MTPERNKPEDFKQAYGHVAIKYQIEFGEEAGDIVRMITQYIAEGWMDWGQGAMMLKSIFEPEANDTPAKNDK